MVVKNIFDKDGFFYCHCGKQVSEEQLILYGGCNECY